LSLAAKTTEASDISPLEKAARRLGLSQADISRRLQVSESAVSRWLKGLREPSPALLLLLGVDGLGQEMSEWRRGRGLLAADQFRFETKLPAGLTKEQARTACLEAIRGLGKGAAR